MCSISFTTLWRHNTCHRNVHNNKLQFVLFQVCWFVLHLKYVNARTYRVISIPRRFNRTAYSNAGCWVRRCCRYLIDIACQVAAWPIMCASIAPRGSYVCQILLHVWWSQQTCLHGTVHVFTMSYVCLAAHASCSYRTLLNVCCSCVYIQRVSCLSQVCVHSCYGSTC